MTKAIDLESRIILAAAKKGEFYSDFLEWAVKHGKAKRSTLVDRKQTLLELGLISQEFLKNQNKRGRPRMRLYMDDNNRRTFMEFFGKPIRT